MFYLELSQQPLLQQGLNIAASVKNAVHNNFRGSDCIDDSVWLEVDFTIFVIAESQQFRRATSALRQSFQRCNRPFDAACQFVGLFRLIELFDVAKEFAQVGLGSNGKNDAVIHPCRRRRISSRKSAKAFSAGSTLPSSTSF